MMQKKEKIFKGSVASKTAVFAVCVVCFLAFVLSILCVVMLFDGDAYVVSRGEFILRMGGSSFNENSIYYVLRFVLGLSYDLRYAVYFIGVIAFIGMITGFIALMCLSGRRKGMDGVYPGPLAKVPFDLLLAVCVAAVVGIWVLIFEMFRYTQYVQLIPYTLMMIITLCVFLGLCMSAAARIKQKSFLRNNVIARILILLYKAVRAVLRGIKSLFENLSVIWKTVVFCVVFLVLDLIILTCMDYHEEQVFALIVYFIRIAAAAGMVYFAITMRRLQKGGQALAAGDLDYHTDTSHMIWDFKKHGENLNSIAGGMSAAVDEKMKSERMKTELITNVSHDLKTPLTSIINYADLISREDTENEKIHEYSEVLTRQSERLKRLIEDLVEASKASSGVLDVDLAPCDPGIFLSQAAGEYEDKLSSSGLELVVKQPDENLSIMADGRRMWRIFDNLMNNACKYSQKGTRVYLSMEKEAGSAVITLKNTSAAALNISADELMERFVRGDASRSTEGNGLGLSIAKSMAELQGGTLDLKIDGDLFKAILRFPLANGKSAKKDADDVSPYSHINMIKYS